jgi:hypothetical protein
MKKQVHYILLSVAASGCSTMHDRLKTTEADHKMLNSSNEQKLAADSEYYSKSASLLLFNDSSDQDYTLQIWPKGKFTYSAANGFQGEAEKMLVSGKMKHASSGSKLSGADQHGKSSIQLLTKQKQKMASGHESTVKKKTISLKWMIAGVVSLVIIGFVLYQLKF